jgi:hypothetical protein
VYIIRVEERRAEPYRLNHHHNPFSSKPQSGDERETREGTGTNPLAKPLPLLYIIEVEERGSSLTITNLTTHHGKW